MPARIRGGQIARNELVAPTASGQPSIALGLSEQDAHVDSSTLRDTARAMSQENMESADRAVERSSTERDLDALLAWQIEDVEVFSRLARD